MQLQAKNDLSEPSSTSKAKFKYVELLEDALLDFYQRHKKVGDDGRICPLPEKFLASIFLLDQAARKYIEEMYVKRIFLPGRQNELLPGVDISIKEISQNAHKYVGLDQKHFKLWLKGGAALRAIKSIIEPIFKAWFFGSFSSRELLSLSFLAYLETPPNDFDLVLDIAEGMDQKTKELLIEKSIIDPLAKKLQALQARLELNPYALVIKLLQSQKYKKKPPYLEKIFKKYPDIEPSMKELHHLCVEAFAFSPAADVVSNRGNFSLRTLGKYDCVFPEGRSAKLATAKHSPLIDLTPIVEGSIKNAPLALGSLLGQTNEKVLQGLSDHNLKLITYDPDIPADVSDFARTISDLTQGARCNQSGWFKAIIQALKQSSIDQGLSLSELLKRQLVGQVFNHNKNEPAVLIAMTFNASALLYWMDPSDEDEIQKLWQLIISHVDIIKKKSTSPLFKSPIIKRIKTYMLDPNFKFSKLYDIYFQLGSNIDQNRTSDWVSHPTQSEDEVFTQWKVPLNIKADKSSNKKTKTARNKIVPSSDKLPSETVKKPPNCVLFFPFQLEKALRHINTLYKIPKPFSVFFNEIISDSSLCYRLGGSRLHKYTDDPRRKYDECLNLSLLLLQKKKKKFWLLGFLTGISLLAQRNDPIFFKSVFDNFLTMLKSRWASIELKNKSITFFCRTLKTSGIVIDPQVFQTLAKREKTISSGLLSALVKSGDHALLLCANEYLNDLENHSDKVDYPELTGLYSDIINVSIKQTLDGSQRNDQVLGHSQWLYKLVDRISRQSVFLPLTKLNWYMQIYTELLPQILNDEPELEEKLFEEVRVLIQQLKKLPSEISKSEVSTFVHLLIYSKNRSKASFKCMHMVESFIKLQLWNEKEQKSIESLIANLDFSLNREFSSRVFKDNDSLLQETLSKYIQLKDPNSNELDKLLFLLNCLAEKKSDFQGINSTLRSVGEKQFHVLSTFQLVEFCRILVRFQRNYGKNYSQQTFELLMFYLEKLKDENLLNQVFNSVCNLLVEDDDAMSLHNDSYSDFISLCHSRPILKCMKNSPTIGKILQRLDSRNMVEAILEFYNVLEQSSVILTCEEFGIIISSLQKTGKNGRYAFSIEKMEELLANPPTIPPNEELLSHLSEIYQYLFTHYCEAHEFIKAHKWIKKEISCYFKRCVPIKDVVMARSFKFIDRLIASEDYLEAKDFLLMLPPSIKLAHQWLNAFSQLLQANQTIIAFEILKKKNLSVLCNFSKHKALWLQTFDKLLVQSHQIAVWEDKAHHNLLLSMHKLAEEIFTNCIPQSKELWKHYFHALTLHGPLKSVEENFIKFFSPDQKTIFSENERNECWKWFFERLCKDGSTLLLDTDLCWLPNKTMLSYKSPEFAILIKSAIRACKLNKEIPNLNDKLHKIEGIINRNAVDYRLDYFLAKLLLYSRDKGLLARGCVHIVGTLLSSKTPPLYNKKAVILTGLYAKLILNYSTFIKYETISTSMHLSFLNFYSDHSDYISFLKILNNITNTSFSAVRKNGIKYGRLSQYVSTNYYHLKFKILRNLIENPNIIIQSSTREEDVKVIYTSILQLIKRDVMDVDTITCLLDNKDKIKLLLGKTASDDIYDFLSKKHRLLHVNFTERIYAKWLDDNASIGFIQERYRIMKETSHRNKFYFYRDELNTVVKRVSVGGIVGLSVCIMIYVLAISVFNSVYYPKR